MCISVSVGKPINWNLAGRARSQCVTDSVNPVTSFGPLDHNRDENCYLADQSLPLWGRWIAEGETDEGGTMFYVHKHFGEMVNPHPTSLTLGHLPLRVRLWPAKFLFISWVLLSVYYSPTGNK